MNTNKNSTFKFPFDINPNFFLGLALLFFIITIKPINELIFPRVSPTSLKAKIEKDIDTKIIDFNSITNDSILMNSVIKQNSNKYQLDRLLKSNFSLFVYQDSNLIFWNSNVVQYPKDTFKFNVATPYKDKSGYYIVYKKRIKKNITAISLIKIKSEDESNRDYVKNYYPVDDKENDFGIDVSFESKTGYVPINYKGKSLFYLFKNDDFFTINDSSGWRLFVNMLPFIFFGISIHTYFKVQIKKQKASHVFLSLLLLILVVRFLGYYFGFPTNYEEYTLFSPEIYASNFINKSLGDLFINVSLYFWITLFFVVNVQGEFKEKHYFNNPLAGIGLIILAIILCCYLGSLIEELVNSSVIIFDTTLVSQIDIFSIVALFIVLIIFAIIFIIIIITHIYLKSCFKKIYYKYFVSIVLLVFGAFLLFALHKNIPSYYYYVSSTLIVYFFFHDSKFFKIKLDFNSYSLLLWLMVISFLGALFMSNLINKKELQTRKDFSEKILQIEDKQFEIQLDKFKRFIEKDPELISLFVEGKKANSKEIHSYIYDEFLNIHFPKYKKNLNVILYPKYGNQSILEVNNEIVQLKKDYPDISKRKKGVFMFHSFNENGYVISFPIIRQADTLAYFFCKFSKKNNIIEKEYSDFLYPNNFRSKVKEYNYSIAIYQNGVFEYRIGNHAFPYYINKNVLAKLKNKESFYINELTYNELWQYNAESNKTIVVSKDSGIIYLISTLFAYIFFIYFSVMSIYILGNIIARSNLKYSRFVNLLSLNLRLRIHASILIVVLISFFAVGYFTYYYLINRVKNKSYSEISNYGQLIQFKINNYFAESNDSSSTNFRIQNDDNFEKFLIEEAVKYAKGINIYSITNGSLIYSSQPDFFFSKVISDRLPYPIFDQLRKGNVEHILNKEKIIDFKYISMYTYIKNSRGKQIAILQLPYFSSEQEAKDETSTILITLINIYVFVFLLSSIIALFLSNSVTKPFKYIVKQFTKINLSKTNEPLKWNNSDEIGLLVKEYNRMLRKLENSTVLLAKSEREMAWREMAKQVAHEIKNPLTPMKLSLQMLEKAIKNKKPNVTELTEKVTTTLIEQIDNLTLIATNFSTFAKMPELQKEVIILNDVLYSVTGMYIDDKNNEYLFLIPDYPIYIFADKSQLIRVFTNIIQNAIQSIPPNRKGNISMVISKIPNNFVRISILDNGEGISSEKALKLFQPYFTTKTSGTGLGLAMCKDIIEKFGGKITFESKLNEGTEFHIDLPIFDENEDLL